MERVTILFISMLSYYEYISQLTYSPLETEFSYQDLIPLKRWVPCKPLQASWLIYGYRGLPILGS